MLAFSVLVDFEAAAAEPGWSPVVIATGEYREHIESLPIEMRPYRPFHFYGNAVRRNYYRGTPLPIPPVNSIPAARLSLLRRSIWAD